MESQIKEDCKVLVSKLDSNIQPRNRQDAVENVSKCQVEPSNPSQVIQEEKGAQSDSQPRNQQDTVDNVSNSCVEEPTCSNPRQGIQEEKSAQSSISRNIQSTVAVGDQFLSSKHSCNSAERTSTENEMSFVTMATTSGHSSCNEPGAERTRTKNDETNSDSIVTNKDVTDQSAQSSSTAANDVTSLETLDTIKQQTAQGKDPVACNVLDAQDTDKVPGLCARTKNSTLNKPVPNLAGNNCNISESDTAQGKDPTTVPSDVQTDAKKCNNGGDVTSDGNNSTEVAAEPSGSEDKGQTSESSTHGGSIQENDEEAALNKLVMSLCRECRQPLADPQPESMVMYLHALTYKVNIQGAHSYEQP